MLEWHAVRKEIPIPLHPKPAGACERADALCKEQAPSKDVYHWWHSKRIHRPEASSLLLTVVTFITAPRDATTTPCLTAISSLLSLSPFSFRRLVLPILRLVDASTPCPVCTMPAMVFHHAHNASTSLSPPDHWRREASLMKKNHASCTITAPILTEAEFAELPLSIQ